MADSDGTILALVPARGGSQALPGKNLMKVGEHSLVGHAVRSAQAVTAISDVVVSSDDESILAEGRAYGAVAELRPQELATDSAGSDDLVRYVLNQHPDAQVLVLLQPTSPLRSPVDVDNCLKALARAPAAATVTELTHPLEWSFRLAPDGGLVPVFGWDAFVRQRQRAGVQVVLNGAVYAATRQYIEDGGLLVGPETTGVLMPADRSIDIDTATDLALARTLDGMGK